VVVASRWRSPRPIGVLAAIYLNEYAPDNWFTRVINLAVVNLAGVPSIVHALFGLGAFVYAPLRAASWPPPDARHHDPAGDHRQHARGAASVPMAFREACWNVGATRWQTIRRVVLPNSISGILTGVILQVSRAAGETAPIMFTGAVFFKAVRAGGTCSPTACSTSAWPCRCTSTPSPRRCPACPRRSPTPPRWCCSARCCWSTPVRHRAARLAARPEEVVSDVRPRQPRRPSKRSPAPRLRRREVLHGISLRRPRNEIFGIIGPAQSGKTSLLRCLNRTIDFHPGRRGRRADPGRRRGRARGAQRLRAAPPHRHGRPLPVGLPLSVYDNVAFAPRGAGPERPGDLDASSSAACGRPRSGTRSRTGSTASAPSSPAASSSG
jgi:hypothetical protein